MAWVFDAGVEQIDWYQVVGGVRGRGSLARVEGQPARIELPGKRSEPDSLAYVLPNGGTEFTRAVTRLDTAVLQKALRCVPLWPAGNQPAVELMQDGLTRYPDAPQWVLCETALFAALPEAVSDYPLPYDLTQHGIRRFGGDGLLHQWLWQNLDGRQSTLRRVVSIHLGDQPNVAALLNGQAVETSYGFSTLEGVPSRTGCGEIDPSIPLLLREQGQTPQKIRHLLAQDSGWQAVAGKKGSLIQLLEAQPANELLHAMLRAHLLKAVGRAMAALGGADALVFTAGDDLPRWLRLAGQVCRSLEFAGVKVLASPCYRKEAWVLSAEDSAIQVLALEAERGAVLSTYL
jgi:acetate kinase